MPDLVTQAEVIAATPKLAGNPDLANLIADASDAVCRYTGQTFDLTSQTELHDGTNLGRIWLRKTPVLLVSSVAINGQVLDNSAGDAWSLNPLSGELRRGRGRDDVEFVSWFPVGHQNVAVNYTAGALTLPGSVRRAVLLVIKSIADSMVVDGRLKSESLGDYSYTVGDPSTLELPQMARFLLGPFILDWIA